MFNFKSMRITTSLAFIGIALGLMGSTYVQQVRAASRAQYLSSGPNYYVRTKKAMYVGIYQRHGRTYRPLIVKKNALLQVSPSMAKRNAPVLGAFTAGPISYDKLSKLRFTAKATIPLTRANFKRVSIKAPVRGKILMAGTGFTFIPGGTLNFGNTSAFYLTMDNYLQYYDSQSMRKFNPHGQMTVSWGDELEVYRPTASVKVLKATVTGNTTTVTYRTPIKGIPSKKIAPHQYQLAITNLHTTGSKHLINDYFGYWNNYMVNDRPYFDGSVQYMG